MVFALEAHITYDREVRAGDPLRITTQILDHDAKRLHFFHAMYHGSEGWLASTNELIMLHIDYAEPPLRALASGDAAPARRRWPKRTRLLPRPDKAGRVIGINAQARRLGSLAPAPLRLPRPARHLVPRRRAVHRPARPGAGGAAAPDAGGLRLPAHHRDLSQHRLAGAGRPCPPAGAAGADPRLDAAGVPDRHGAGGAPGRLAGAAGAGAGAVGSVAAAHLGAGDRVAARPRRRAGAARHGRRHVPDAVHPAAAGARADRLRARHRHPAADAQSGLLHRRRGARRARLALHHRHARGCAAMPSS